MTKKTWMIVGLVLAGAGLYLVNYFVPGTFDGIYNSVLGTFVDMITGFIPGGEV